MYGCCRPEKQDHGPEKWDHRPENANLQTFNIFLKLYGFDKPNKRIDKLKNRGVGLSSGFNRPKKFQTKKRLFRTKKNFLLKYVKKLIY